MVPHYAETGLMKTILLLFFTHEKISYNFDLPWKMYNYWNVHQRNNMPAKKQGGNFFTISSHTKFKLNLILDILTKPNAFITHDQYCNGDI